jgi:hypothetical protein
MRAPVARPVASGWPNAKPWRGTGFPRFLPLNALPESGVK